MDEDMCETIEEHSDLNNLIINYLPETVDQEDLHKMFSSFGDIESCKLIRDKAKGHSLGYGFVKFADKEHARNALNNLDGLMLQHKKIKVSFARPASEPIKTANVYVSGLKNTISEAELISVFSVYGKVLTVKLKNNDGDSRRCSAIGFVRFEKHKNAEEAIEQLDQTKPLNNPTPIHVAFAKQTKEQGSLLDPMTSPPVGLSSGLFSHMSKSLLPFPNPKFSFGKAATFSKNLRFDPLGKNNFRGNMNDSIFNNSDIYSPMPPPTEKGYVLFVFNLTPDLEEVKLWRLFGPFGAVNDIKIVMDKETNQGKGFGFVTMANYRDAEMAIQSLNQTPFEGKVLQVSFKKEKHKK